jgi:hypothetical protein
MTTQTEQRYDVVIYEIATRKIDTIAGKDLRPDSGHFNAERRLETLLSRLNDRYNAEIVDAGKYQKGDVLS